jgi:hypothetical protein
MEISKKSNGETLFDLTLFVADTHVNPSPPQAKGKAPTTHATSGLGCETPLANYDLNTQSWRMCEVTLVSDSPPFSGKWPASGMTQSGKLFPQPQLVRRIVEIASLSWPTPRNSSAMSEDIGTIQERLENGKPYKSRLEEAIALAPTPSGNWPTPTASDVFTDNLKSSQQTDGSVSLGQAVQMWPTPKSTDYKAAVIWPQSKTHSRDMALRETIAERNPEHVGGRLNPTWVEWLMGFPLGWTDLEDSETPSSHK